MEKVSICARALKNGIIKLYEDLEFRVKLATNARKKSKQHNVDVVSPKILDIYKKVIN